MSGPAVRNSGVPEGVTEGVFEMLGGREGDTENDVELVDVPVTICVADGDAVGDGVLDGDGVEVSVFVDVRVMDGVGDVEAMYRGAVCMKLYATCDAESTPSCTRSCPTAITPPMSVHVPMRGLSRRIASESDDVTTLGTPSRYTVSVSGGAVVVLVYVTAMWCHAPDLGRTPIPATASVVGPLDHP